MSNTRIDTSARAAAELRAKKKEKPRNRTFGGVAVAFVLAFLMILIPVLLAWWGFSIVVGFVVSQTSAAGDPAWVDSGGYTAAVALSLTCVGLFWPIYSWWKQHRMLAPLLASVATFAPVLAAAWLMAIPGAPEVPDALRAVVGLPQWPLHAAIAGAIGAVWALAGGHHPGSGLGRSKS